MKKYVWLTGLAAAGVLAAGVLLYPGNADAANLPAGITVGQLSLEGMTKDEADQKIQEYVDGMANQEITLTVDGHEVKTTAAGLGFKWTNQKEIEDAAAQYSGGNLLERYAALKSLEKKPVKLSVESSVDEDKLAAFVNDKCAGYVRLAKDAEITRENGIFHVTDSADGLEVDMEATKNALDDAVKGGLTKPVTVAAVVKVSKPVRTKEALSTIRDELGTYSTNFSTGNVSRSTNLRNGASKVNGTVVMPGEEFSAYGCLAPFTRTNGYAAAGTYENGRVVDSLGGGACQLSTTMYNAALRSELDITQRQNHSMLVAYVKPSEDAAIAGTFKDLKFKNNYDTPIYIEGSVTGGTLTFTVYGKETRPENRTIKFVSETLGTTDPGEPALKEDPSLAPGARVKEQSSHVGKRSRLWKYVYVDGVETEKTLLHTDSYMASKAVYRVGPDIVQPVVDPQPIPVPETSPQTQPYQPAGPASDGPAGDTHKPTGNPPTSGPGPAPTAEPAPPSGGPVSSGGSVPSGGPVSPGGSAAPGGPAPHGGPVVSDEGPR